MIPDTLIQYTINTKMWFLPFMIFTNMLNSDIQCKKLYHEYWYQWYGPVHAQYLEMINEIEYDKSRE